MSVPLTLSSHQRQSNYCLVKYNLNRARYDEDNIIRMAIMGSEVYGNCD